MDEVIAKLVPDDVLTKVIAPLYAPDVSYVSLVHDSCHGRPF